MTENELCVKSVTKMFQQAGEGACLCKPASVKVGVYNKGRAALFRKKREMKDFLAGAEAKKRK